MSLKNKQMRLEIRKGTFGAGIDLTKRKSGMHFFEMQVETKKIKNLKFIVFSIHPLPSD